MSSQMIELHPTHPSQRMLGIIHDALLKGAVIAYPTDSGYALGCAMGQKAPLKRIQRIRDLDSRHNFTLICRDLSEISRYAKVDNRVYRLLKHCTPGGYTFILKASSDVPRLMLAKRKTVGIRIPEHAIALAIVENLGEPLLSTTLIMPGDDEPLLYAEDVGEALGHQVDIVIEGGYCGFEPTTVVDCTDDVPVILREGSGDVHKVLG